MSESRPYFIVFDSDLNRPIQIEKVLNSVSEYIPMSSNFSTSITEHVEAVTAPRADIAYMATIMAMTIALLYALCPLMHLAI
jgi:hypothetical protein